MPRPRSGTVQKFVRADGTIVWRARLRLRDGSRPWQTLPPEITTEDDARAFARKLQALEERHGEILIAQQAKRKSGERRPGPRGENVREWWARFHKACEARGQRTVRDRRGRYAKWLDPIIGDRPISGEGRVDREAIRTVVARLDAQIALRAAFHRGELGRANGCKPGLSAKTAANVWQELCSGFEEACTSKDDDLRVRDEDDDPTRGVKPPESGDTREQAALYSDEVVKLLGCADVPAYRREVYALCIFAGLRQSEARALVAADIDTDHGVINVRRQRRAKGATTKTKTRAGMRQIPIEPDLAPLLALLIRRAETDHATRLRSDPDATPGPLVRVPPMEDCAERIREDLIKAGCSRAELHTDDEERMHFTFHGLRHSALTHWAVAGKPLPWIMAAAGHRSYEATQHYVDLGAVLRAQRFGEPHPPLPLSLLRSTEQSIALGAPELRVRRRKQKGRILEGSDPSSHIAFATPAGIEDDDAAEDDGVSPGYLGPFASQPKAPTEDRYATPRGERSTEDHSDPLDDALARALRAAADRGDLALVAKLAEELRVRRRIGRGS